jgi:hypothetical protein
VPRNISIVAVFNQLSRERFTLSIEKSLSTAVGRMERLAMVSPDCDDTDINVLRVSLGTQPQAWTTVSLAETSGKKITTLIGRKYLVRMWEPSTDSV